MTSLSLSLVNIMYYTEWIVHIETCLHPRDDSHLILVPDLFTALLSSFAAGVQPRLMQGVRRRDGVGEYLFIYSSKI